MKAQQWRLDPNLIINNYINALEKVFNKNKKNLLIRKTTLRPYLSSQNLREAFLSNTSLLKNNNDAITKFVENVVKYNKELVMKISIELAHDTKDIKIKQRAVDIDFALAYDTKLKWVGGLLADL